MPESDRSNCVTAARCSGLTFSQEATRAASNSRSRTCGVRSQTPWAVAASGNIRNKPITPAERSKSRKYLVVPSGIPLSGERR